MHSDLYLYLIWRIKFNYEKSIYIYEDVLNPGDIVYVGEHLFIVISVKDNVLKLILKNCIETSFYERLDECCSEFRGLLVSKERELFSKYDVTCEVPSILDCMTYVTKDMRIFRDLNGIAKPWWIKNDEDRENYINEQGYFNKTNMLKSNIGFRPMLTIRTKSAIDRRDFKMNNIFNDINTKTDLLKFVDDSEIKIIYKDKIIVPIYDSMGNIESCIEYCSKSEADKTKDESIFYDSNEELNDININGVKNRRIE